MRRVVQAGIVVLLVLICVALLLPSVARVRGAAARMNCHGQNCQLGVAYHNYLDANEHTVPGTHPNPDLPPEQRLSWAYLLLPFIEQHELHKAVDQSQAWNSTTNAVLTSTRLRHLACPALTDYRTTNRLSYLGVAGVGADAATLPADDPRIGSFGYDRTLKWEEITDGTANTLLLLETRSGGPWAQGGPGTVRGLDPNDRPHHGFGRPFEGDHGGEKWWQKKVNTTTMTLCDGSVRTLRDSVSPEVLEALATIRGKEEVPGEW